MDIKNLISGKEEDIISYVKEFYDPDLHGEVHWFTQEIDGHEIDIKVLFEDDILEISAYPVDFGYYDEFVKIL